MDKVLFIRHFVVLILAVCVDVIPSYSNVSPPTVTLTLCISFLCRPMLSTSLVPVTLRPYGIAWYLMNLIVFIPDFMRIPTPCTIIPMSLARARDHNTFAGVHMRCLYLCMFPVSGLITEFHRCAVLSGGGPRSLLMLKMAVACCAVLGAVVA